MILVTKTSDQTCMYVCMYIYSIAHNRAVRPCHPSQSFNAIRIDPPKGGSMILITKPLIMRDRGDTLSLLVQFLLEP